MPILNHPQSVPNAALTDDQMIAKIDHLIKNPPLNSRIFTITPPVAQHLLDTYNSVNRPKKPGNIDRYAGDMANNQWWLTGDTLKFSDKGLLRDGQNRLEGCVAATVPFETHIVFGIDDKCFAFLDRGKNRGPSDVLAIEKVKYHQHVAAAIRWIEKLESNPKDRDGIEPHAYLDLWRNKYKKTDIIDRVEEARAIYSATRHPVGMVAAVLFLARRSNARKAAEFAAAWEARGVVKAGKGGKQLGAMIKALDEVAATSSGRVHDVVRAAWAIQTWNAFVNGQRVNVKSYTWGPKDVFPDML